MVNNRRAFGPGLPGVDHLRHTHDPSTAPIIAASGKTGADLADDLERLVGPARRGDHRRGDRRAGRRIDRRPGAAEGLPRAPARDRYAHGILLIFDEVITGFGRLGAPTASEYFGVTPDLISCAKGITNAAVPMGAVVAGNHIYDAVVDQGPAGIEFFHGYTYSGHPLAAAAGLAALDIYENDGLFDRAATMSAPFGDAAPSDARPANVIDVRNLGLVAGVEVRRRPGAPGARAAWRSSTAASTRACWSGPPRDVIALSPPLILEQSHIDEMFEVLAKVIETVE